MFSNDTTSTLIAPNVPGGNLRRCQTLYPLFSLVGKSPIANYFSTRGYFCNSDPFAKFAAGDAEQRESENKILKHSHTTAARVCRPNRNDKTQRRVHTHIDPPGLLSKISSKILPSHCYNCLARARSPLRFGDTESRRCCESRIQRQGRQT